ncbi:MAG: hypothetical protein RLZZ184_1564 [Cyanobacteriota bacterium]|jgi:hypothetical protein
MGFSIKDFASLVSIKEKLFPPAERPVEINPDEKPAVKKRFNPKRVVTFHSRMIKFYEMAIEEAESIGESDYVDWLGFRLEKEKRNKLKQVQYVQKISFDYTLERFKLD